jgi:predicted membrane metal-binding protein
VFPDLQAKTAKTTASGLTHLLALSGENVAFVVFAVV